MQIIDKSWDFYLVSCFKLKQGQEVFPWEKHAICYGATLIAKRIFLKLFKLIELGWTVINLHSVLLAPKGSATLALRHCKAVVVVAASLVWPNNNGSRVSWMNTGGLLKTCLSIVAFLWRVFSYCRAPGSMNIEQGTLVWKRAKNSTVDFFYNFCFASKHQLWIHELLCFAK